MSQHVGLMTNLLYVAMVTGWWCNLFAISHANLFVYHLAGPGRVGFGVTAEQDEFSDYEFELPTSNNQVLLEDIHKQLDLHKPPLRLRTVNNMPAAARPGNRTLAANFKDGDRLKLVVDIAPGDSTWKQWFLLQPKPLLFMISCMHGSL